MLAGFDTIRPMPTLVCVAIMVQDPPSALADAAASRDAGADLVEFRIDEFFAGDQHEADAVVRLVADSPLPCIVTCRVTSEGGHYEGDEMARVSLFERLGRSEGKGEHPPRYIDIELASYTRSANLRQKVDMAVGIPDTAQPGETRASLILSTHDMTTRPPDLLRRFAALNQQAAASVIKIAYRARSLRDSLELLDLPAQAHKPTIALGMGEFGLLSRVLAPKFGGFLTFAALRSAAATAPGQPTVRELLDLYRFRAISSKTAVYGIVGWPVSHSLSPLVHNAGFDEIGHDGVYIPLPIAAGDDSETTYLSLKATLLELIHHPRLNLRGVSITAPHKEGVLWLARESGWEIDPAAAGIGAANTLVIDPDEAEAPSPLREGRGGVARPPTTRVRVLNTDAPAAAECLAQALGPLEGKRIGVVGAGGVGRAVAYGAAQQGATVVIYSRDLERAAAVESDIEAAIPGAKLIAAETGLLPRTCCDALVNCTPVGMKDGPSPKELSIPVDAMSGCDRNMVVMDTVYAPLQTPLLQAAKAAGFRTIDGAVLFVLQAQAQFGLWTGTQPQSGIFDRLARDALTARDAV
jgi:3-dehydroquinate dehydratase/shikimate dehydrogenase